MNEIFGVIAGATAGLDVAQLLESITASLGQLFDFGSPL